HEHPDHAATLAGSHRSYYCDQGRRQTQIMSSPPSKGRRSNQPNSSSTRKPASTSRRRQAGSSSQCSVNDAAASPERTDNVSVHEVSSQSARSKMSGSRSSHRPSVSSMSSREGAKTSKTKRPPGASTSWAACTARRFDASSGMWSNERKGH